MILVCNSTTVGILVVIEILVWFCSFVCTRDTCVHVSNSWDTGGDRDLGMVLFICMHM